MIAYEDGTEMKVGDDVLIEHETIPGVITEIIESIASQKEWNVEEPGVMLKSPPFGLLFLPVSTFAHDPIRLVQRNEP